MIRCSYWLLIIALALPVVAEELAPSTMSLAKTPYGTVQVWHRTPAVAADLEMPIFSRGLVLDSYVYRVRDRKKRDLMRYVHVRLTTTRPVEEVLNTYTEALGKDAGRETDPETGEITLSGGTPEDVRLVVITPAAGYITLRLERVQRFQVPPRVYDAREERVVRVLGQVAQAYRDAGRITFEVAQSIQVDEPLPEGMPLPPTLRWTIAVTRPDQLTLKATVEDEVGLEITTQNGALIVARPNREPEIRPLEGALTLELLPELQGDPVAKLLFGDDLLVGVDYLALQSVPGVPSHHAAIMTLTYPEENLSVVLHLDLRRKVVTRSEMQLTGEDHQHARMVRDYANIVLDAAPSPTRSQPDPAVTVP